MKMLTELCGYLKNWFEVERLYGEFKITSGAITYADGTELPLQNGQHFRIIDSVFNDGVYSYPPATEDPASVVLKDEEFKAQILNEAAEIEAAALKQEAEILQIVNKVIQGE